MLPSTQGLWFSIHIYLFTSMLVCWYCLIYLRAIVFLHWIIKYEQLCIICYCIKIIGRFKWGNVWLTVKLAVLNAETRIRLVYYHVSLLTFFFIPLWQCAILFLDWMIKHEVIVPLISVSVCKYYRQLELRQYITDYKLATLNAEIMIKNS